MNCHIVKNKGLEPLQACVILSSYLDMPGLLLVCKFENIYLKGCVCSFCKTLGSGRHCLFQIRVSSSSQSLQVWGQGTIVGVLLSTASGVPRGGVPFNILPFEQCPNSGDPEQAEVPSDHIQIITGISLGTILPSPLVYSVAI